MARPSKDVLKANARSAILLAIAPYLKRSLLKT